MFFYVIITSIIMIGFIIYLVYYSNAHKSSKYATIPISIFLAIWMSLTFIDYSGVPIVGYPNGEWVYVYHRITFDGKYVFLWVVHDGTKERLYKIPYSREVARKLGSALSQQTEYGSIMTLGEFSDIDGKRRNPMLTTENFEIFQEIENKDE